MEVGVERSTFTFTFTTEALSRYFVPRSRPTLGQGFGTGQKQDIRFLLAKGCK